MVVLSHVSSKVHIHDELFYTIKYAIVGNAIPLNIEWHWYIQY